MQNLWVCTRETEPNSQRVSKQNCYVNKETNKQDRIPTSVGSKEEKGKGGYEDTLEDTWKTPFHITL